MDARSGQTLLDEITKAIDDSGLTQEEIAIRVGVGQQTISAWKTGKSIPSLANVLALADVLGQDAVRWRDMKVLAMSTRQEMAASTSVTGTGHKSSEQSDLDTLALASGVDPQSLNHDEKTALQVVFDGIRARRGN